MIALRPIRIPGVTGSVGVDRLHGLIAASRPLLGGLVGAFALIDSRGEPVFVTDEAQAIWHALAGGASEATDYVGYDSRGRAYPADGWPLRRALATGERIDREQVTVRFANGSSGVVRLSASPVYEAGEVVGALVQMIDVTLEARRVAALGFLAEAAELLASSTLSVTETLDHLASLAVPRLADWCSIELMDGGRIEQVAVAHVDPDRRRYARELAGRYPTDTAASTGAAAVIRTGRSELISEITDELIDKLVADPEMRRIVHELGLYSSMVVPMTVAGRTLGALTLVSAEQRHRFDQTDLALAEQVAHRAAVAIDTARRFEREAAIAATLIAAAAPPALPVIPGVELAVIYRPATTGLDVAGDLYDVWELPDGFGLVVGDVEGKGPPAAAVAALVRHTARALGRAYSSPSAVLEAVNEDLRHAELGRFCTAVVVIACRTPDTVRLSVASAGHPPPLIRRASGEVESVPAAGGLLGVYDELGCTDTTVTLDPRDLLFAYTDGVTERRGNRGVIAETELEAVVRLAGRQPTAEAVARAIDDAAAGWARQSARDDVAMLVVKVMDGRNGRSHA